MIAIISHSLEFAKNKLRSQGDVESFNEASCQGTFFSRREFFIATRPEHLQGKIITDYIIAGTPEPEMIELARACLR